MWPVKFISDYWDDESDENVIVSVTLKAIRHAIPRPGQMVTLTDPPPLDPWWNGDT